MTHLGKGNSIPSYHQKVGGGVNWVFEGYKKATGELGKIQYHRSPVGEGGHFGSSHHRVRGDRQKFLSWNQDTKEGGLANKKGGAVVTNSKEKECAGRR